MALYELDGIRVETPGPGRYWVADSATVIGRVRLEEDTSVWFNSVIRGDNEPIRIGRGTNIQEGCVLHTDPGYPLTIAERSLVGHMAMLHGCTIGSNTLIGIGAIVLNGCRIGDNCIIGAHTILAENKEIPSGSVVIGVPGKIVRQTRPEDIAKVKEDVQHYIDNWKRFAKGMKRQD